MTRKSLAKFILVGFLWGIPYLFMRVAVREFDPSVVVFGRVVIGAAILFPIAISRGVMKQTLRGFKWILVYAIFEMCGPWYLITHAETKINSGLAGLLVATVPIWSTIYSSMAGDKTVWHAKRLMGIVIGFFGLILIVGIETISGTADTFSVFQTVLAAILYSTAMAIILKGMPNGDGVAINAVAMTITAIIFAPSALSNLPTEMPSFNATASLIGLGVLSTGIAFMVYFTLIKEIGQARGSMVTYLNTAFAVVLGVIILGEPLTFGIIAGLPLVLIGSYFASRKPVTP
ncbi:MAG: DMT family transporter [Candidatus Nanopelagicaceae bacterium]|jgi:drug/metabolite transporter (DMT)-like permease|nr:DMT family transporter [Candidatus Nanopelagicaceae bacterium]